MLPKITTPEYTMTIPSTGKEIKYRPFLVREQKILLLALESQSDDDIFNSTKQILQSCILTDGVDVDELSSFDIEYLFIQLRTKSLGEVVNATYVCRNMVNERNGILIDPPEECGHRMNIDYDLTNTTVYTHPNHSNKVMLDASRKFGLVMKYPTLKLMKDRIDTKDALVDQYFSMVVDCIDKVFDGDTVYQAKQASRSELEELVNSMPNEYLNKIGEFFDTMPVVRQILDKKCEKCGFEHKIVLEGLPSFFV